MNKTNLLKNDNKKENAIFSPYSLLVALSMLNEGASGHTREELNNILEHEEVKKIESIKDAISIFNKIYIKESINSIINDDYKKTIIDKYNADIELNSLKKVSVINKYIEKSTFGQIKNMLDEINGNMLLINTIAVDMDWPFEIRGDAVSKGIFNNIEASYIYGFNKHMSSLYKDEEVTALGLNLKEYGDSQYECILIQPEKIDLDSFIDRINDDSLNSIMNNLKPLYDDQRTIKIAVPKFSFSYAFDANTAFSKQGLDLLHPDLSGITKISDEMNIIHKANIDFSEKGLKAAAATVVELLCGAALIKDVLYITINKPFIFVIREKTKGTILFMGKVYKPVLWKDDEKNYSYI